jgi:hypothetical protein
MCDSSEARSAVSCVSGREGVPVPRAASFRRHDVNQAQRGELLGRRQAREPATVRSANVEYTNRQVRELG